MQILEVRPVESSSYELKKHLASLLKSQLHSTDCLKQIEQGVSVLPELK